MPTKNKPVKAKIRRWVSALRSGEYEQTENALRTGGGFCCLGVACDLYRKEVGGRWKYNHESGDWKFHTKGQEPVSGLLPATVRNWLGVPGTGTEDDVPVKGHFLSKLNDGGRSFSEIAAHIEAAFLPKS